MSDEPIGQDVLTAAPQAGIFLVATVRPGSELPVAEALTGIAGLAKSVAFREPEGVLSCVIGIGSAAWDRMYGAPKPAGLHPFPPLAGAKHVAPATAGDLLIHLRAARADLCFELARQILLALGHHVDIVDETHGFRYFDQRDLLGFVDGTENPVGRAAARAITVGGEDPAFVGGSYVIVQKYLHDLTAWDRLTVEEQELVIGRRKLSDIELSEHDKPSNSHVALNTITAPDGTEREIFRQNMPFGSFGDDECGTYFIGYASTPDVIEEMLRNMFLGKPEGNHDRILDFSTAVTGGLFYVPTVDFLADPARPIDDAAGDSSSAPVAPRAIDDAADASRTTPVTTGIPDGSLGIGTLKGNDPS